MRNETTEQAYSVGYSNGRLNVIDELMAWCRKEIARVEAQDSHENKYKRATQTGIIRSYKKILVTLEVKAKRAEKKVKFNRMNNEKR